MPGHKRRRTRLHCELLEARNLLAGNLPWPIAGPGYLGVLSTYGQFIEGGGLHFHEGVDVLTKTA